MSRGGHNAINLSGQVFGKLTALERVESRNRNAVWLCQCECGKKVTRRSDSLRNGKTTSCGCKKSKDSQEAKTIHGHAKQGNQSSTYMAWRTAKKEKHPDEWKEFCNFLRDVGEKPDSKAVLTRKDRTKPHSKENTYWRTNATNHDSAADEEQFLDLRSIALAEAADRERTKTAELLSRQTES